MRFIWILIFSILGLSVAAAADKDCLPSGERVDNFLIRQVGGGFAELTTDTQKKKPLQLLMEELVLADGRKNTKSKWLDDLSSTKPKTKPDIAPRLSTATLYKDIAGANAHWEAFRRRYPATAEYLQDCIGRPTLSTSTLPGQDVTAYREKLITYKFLNQKDLKGRLRTAGEGLLYVDFLYSRGNDAAKLEAYRLLEAMSGTLLWNAPDKYFTRTVMLELAWPMIEPGTQRDSSQLREDLITAVSSSDKEAYHIKKWIANTPPAPDELPKIESMPKLLADLRKTFPNEKIEEKNVDPSLRLSKKSVVILMLKIAYEKEKDYVGALLYQMAAYPMPRWTSNDAHMVRLLLGKVYDAPKTAEYYRRFLEAIAPDCKEPFVRQELAALKAPPTPSQK